MPGLANLLLNVCTCALLAGYIGWFGTNAPSATRQTEPIAEISIPVTGALPETPPAIAGPEPALSPPAASAVDRPDIERARPDVTVPPLARRRAESEAGSDPAVEVPARRDTRSSTKTPKAALERQPPAGKDKTAPRATRSTSTGVPGLNCAAGFVYDPSWLKCVRTQAPPTKTAVNPPSTRPDEKSAR